MKELQNLPRVRMSLYRYRDDSLYHILTSFRANALQQGWTPSQIEKLIESANNLEGIDLLYHLQPYYVITKLPKGRRIKKGKV